MNRCVMCGRKLKNSETTCGVEFCKVCEKYEKQLAENYKDLRVYAKALDIIAFNLVCTIAGLKTKEEKKAKKEEFKKLALEVAEFLVDENNELMEVK